MKRKRKELNQWIILFIIYVSNQHIFNIKAEESLILSNQLGKVPFNRAFHTATAVDTNIYVFGGTNPELEDDFGTLYCYNICKFIEN